MTRTCKSGSGAQSLVAFRRAFSYAPDRYGGCASETFGSAGFLNRSCTPTHSCHLFEVQSELVSAS
ncbi:hypothetical protein EMIT0232MI5_40300 [Pseudomonas sp. IT-232MI5]